MHGIESTPANLADQLPNEHRVEVPFDNYLLSRHTESTHFLSVSVKWFVGFDEYPEMNVQPTGLQSGKQRQQVAFHPGDASHFGDMNNLRELVWCRILIKDHGRSVAGAFCSQARVRARPS